MIRKKKKKNIIVCPLTKQFKNIVVCAVNCDKKCTLYHDKLDVQVLIDYVEKHPEYKLIGELMPTAKPKKTVNKYWVVNDEDKTFAEVTEKELMNNPKEYLDKKIWQKPPFSYQLVVTLKRIKED
jgi:hypothetical protein